MDEDRERTKNEALVEKLDNMYPYEMTVAEVANLLAGHPPMMEVFALVNGTLMYINGAKIKFATHPYLLLECSPYPRLKPKDDDLSHDERIAKQRQRALEMGDLK